MNEIFCSNLIKNTIEKIIKIEKPDAILPTMGGQTSRTFALFVAGFWYTSETVQTIRRGPEPSPRRFFCFTEGKR